MEMMVHQDLAEDLGREVPWETVDQLEDRYIFRRHVMTWTHLETFEVWLCYFVWLIIK